MRTALVILLGLLACATQMSPAHAFGRLGCFEAPSAHRPIAQLIGEIDASLINRRPPETRACEYYARGLLYHFEGQTQRAIADYTSAIGWMNSFRDAYAARGDAYEDIGQPALAAADYARAQELDKGSSEERMERCWIRALRGRPLARALEDCNASLTLTPDDFDALTSRCLVYERMGNYAAAISDCNSALSRKSANPTALFVRGLAKLRSGDLPGGNADIATARRLGESVAETFALYGITMKDATAPASHSP